MKKHYILKAGLCFIIMFAIMITNSVSTFANSPSLVSPLTTNDLRSFGKNGIYYFTPGAGDDCVIGDNADYTGGQVLSGAILDAIKTNQSFYKSAAKKYGIDWKLIATVHVMETNASRTNPSNGQGVYQLASLSERFPGGHVLTDSEFQYQTDLAAQFILRKAGGSNPTSSDAVKRLFFAYNGTAQRYIDKAIAMGFSEAAAHNGEGSPYVMNWYDDRRDPRSSNMDPNWPGMYVRDGVWNPTAKMARPGAFTVYASLGGGTGNSQVCYISGPGGGRLPTGEYGMTLQEAQNFMNSYKNAIRGKSNSYLISTFGMTDNDCTGGVGYNCVSFTKYFINTYTTFATHKITGSIGDGKDVTGRLLTHGFTNLGNTPKAYAIFSTGFNKEYGHTGVILGYNTKTMKAVIGEASCGDGESGIRAYEKNINEITNGSYKFVYAPVSNMSK